MIANKNYYERLGIQCDSTGSPINNYYNKQKAKVALDYALDVRKFEIEMYWKRANYFWALIAVAFAGCFAILAGDAGEGLGRELYAFMISCAGLVFSSAWVLANKGSKLWQENWEKHVSMLEDLVIGSLFKTTLTNLNNEERKNNNLKVSRFSIDYWGTKPDRYSVSKINGVVSIFTVIAWSFLLWHTGNINIDADLDWFRICIFASALITIILMICSLGRSNLNNIEAKIKTVAANIYD